MNLSAPMLRTIPAVATGGIVGAAARWGVNELIGSGELPWSTLVVNVVGSAVLGWVASALMRAQSTAVLGEQLPRPDLLVALGAGFCGAFTTFSAFAVETAQYLNTNDAGRAAIYVALTVVLGLVAAALGRSLHGRIAATT